MNAYLHVNKGKLDRLFYNQKLNECLVIKTPLITENDDLDEVINDYIKPFIEKDDVVFISEKIIAILQNRAILLNTIEYGFWAEFLSRFVQKSERGIGLGMPETMQCAIDEVGLFRILVAATISCVGKLLKQSGWFYHVAGRKVAAIDGPCHYTLPPYNKYVVLAPVLPNEVSEYIRTILCCRQVLIVDCNDFGVEILGNSGDAIDVNVVKKLLKQNPLGQSTEQTPVGIFREILK